MQMQEIVDEIANLSQIQLKDADFVGSGSYASVYRYRIKNYPVAVKCFQNQVDAEKEYQIFEEVRRLTLSCPGIIEYYGMKKL